MTLAAHEVYLNGKVMENVIYADANSGVVKTVDVPIRQDRYGYGIMGKSHFGDVSIVKLDSSRGVK